MIGEMRRIKASCPQLRSTPSRHTSTRRARPAFPTGRCPRHSKTRLASLLHSSCGGRGYNFWRNQSWRPNEEQMSRRGIPIQSPRRLARTRSAQASSPRPAGLRVLAVRSRPEPQWERSRARSALPSEPRLARCRRTHRQGCRRAGESDRRARVLAEQLQPATLRQIRHVL